MLFNAIEGIIENGQIRLSEKVSLPEHSKVYVVLVDAQVDRVAGVKDRSARIPSPRLAHPAQVTDFGKQVVELAPDAEL